MTNLIHVADRILGRPLLCLPEKVETILGVLGPRIGTIDAPVLSTQIAVDDLITSTVPTASRFAGRPAEHGKYRVTSDGIAIVPILGTLVNRGAWLGASSGLTSYEGLAEQLRTVDSDVRRGAVKALVLDMDTPGGEASGAFEIPGMIREIKTRIPVIAMVNDMAASAGYAIASAASKIYVTQTGLVGSIGVVLVHFDRSKQMEMAGIAPTIIHAGAKKADGNPYGPLPAAVRDRLKAEVEGLRELFIDTVAAGRPGLKKADIKATEAGCFMGASAVEIGLADGIATFDMVLSSLRNATGAAIAPAALQATSSQETQPMAETTAPAPAPATDSASLDAAAARGRSEGEQAGRTAERARIKGIIGSPEAAGREQLAHHLAFETDNTVEAAVGALKASAKAAPTSANSAKELYSAMAATGGKPQVSGVHTGDGGGANAGVSDFVSSALQKWPQK